MLFLSYLIGLWFTLRTHAATIWTEIEEKKALPTPGINGVIPSPHPAHHQAMKQQSSSSAGTINRNAIRETQLYKRILGHSLKQVGLSPSANETQSTEAGLNAASPQNHTPYLVPPKSGEGEHGSGETSSLIEGLSEEQNEHLVRQVAEMAATAATVAARDATRAPRKAQIMSQSAPHQLNRKASFKPSILHGDLNESITADAHTADAPGGHDAPNWSRTKSAVILLGATVLYAVIAEILVNTVDVVLESVDIEEKFLGITLFALVPNTTEFLVRKSYATCFMTLLIDDRMLFHLQ